MTARKRRDCRMCGRPFGPHQEFVEVRVLDWRSLGERVRRWKSKTMMTAYVCPACAAGMIDRMDEGRAR